jgi:glycosyltransferase involved in cell wall biosynthesis
MTRIRVLAIAYACNPTRGSEDAVGWGWINAIAQQHDVTVITADYNKPDIEAIGALQGGTEDSLQFRYVKNRPWHYRPWGVWAKIEASPAKPIMSLAYSNWLGHALLAAENEMASGSYDLVHLITYVGWRFCGKFYRLNLPFVWGPIGGLMNTPWRLMPALGLKGALYHTGRNIVNSLQIALLPGPRKALSKAGGAVIAATPETQRALAAHFGSASRVICEVGLPDVGLVDPPLRAPNEDLRICWSGPHIPRKALHLLLNAAALLPKESKFSIQILGDGPSSKNWRALAQRLRVADRCTWHGRLPRSAALEVMKTSHAFVITSLNELTSTVAVEAISVGLPVVTLNHCGMADLVTDTCGIKVDVRSVDQIIHDLSLAILRLMNDEALRRSLSQGALLRSLDYSWSKKLASLNEVYSVALGSHNRTLTEAAAFWRPV